MAPPLWPNREPTTHEIYLHAVRDVVIARAWERGTITSQHAERLAHTKLMYGVGDGTYRGVTVFDAWENGVGPGRHRRGRRDRSRVLEYSLPEPSSTTR